MIKLRRLREFAFIGHQTEWTWVWSRHQTKTVVIRFSWEKRKVGCLSFGFPKHIIYVLLHLTLCTVVCHARLDCEFLKDRNLIQFTFIFLIPSIGSGTQKIINKCFLNRRGKDRIPYLNYFNLYYVSRSFTPCLSTPRPPLYTALWCGAETVQLAFTNSSAREARVRLCQWR